MWVRGDVDVGDVEKWSCCCVYEGVGGGLSERVCWGGGGGVLVGFCFYGGGFLVWVGGGGYGGDCVVFLFCLFICLCVMVWVYFCFGGFWVGGGGVVVFCGWVGVYGGICGWDIFFGLCLGYWWW
uniref:Uncharacterized protein n=1 Tax=Knipowitschia caucasica TaxID=637954 RepID=A0AAV2LTZ7_KNICA